MRAKRPLILIPVAALLGASAIPLPASAANATLPGGTPISVEINSPANGALLPPGPVTVSGQASVGRGVPVINTGLVYVLDLSSSTIGAAVGCGGDQNGDGVSNEVVDCEIAAAKGLNDRAATTGSTVGQVGVVAFGSDAVKGDLSPAPSPPGQPVTGPATDADNQNGRDVEEVLSSARVRGGSRLDFFPPARPVGALTDFEAAVRETTSIVGDLTMPREIVVFMSDGVASDGGPIADAVTALHGTGARVFTFAVGGGASCDDRGGNRGSLSEIAGNGGTCRPVTTVSDLPNDLLEVIRSELTSLTLRVDSGLEIPITNVTPSLPRDGPVTVNYSVTTGFLAPGPHQLCVTANGRDNGQENEGRGSVIECHTVTINAPPVVDAGGPYSGNEDNPVSIVGTVTDPDGPPGTSAWTIVPGADVPAGSVCTFGNPNEIATTVACTERGTYTLTLTATDGLHPPVSDTATLTLRNVAPTVDAGGPYAGNEDNQVAIAGTATDPDGPALTTTWSIVPASGVPAGSVCTFGNADALSTTVSCTERGTYTLSLTANDGVNPPVVDRTTLTLRNVAPTVDAGGPYDGTEDNAVPIEGTVTDPDGPPFTVTWTIEPTEDVPEGATCTFADPAALSTVVTCTERGTYTLTLAVSDGVNPPVPDETTLTLVNIPPEVSAGGPYLGQDNVPVPIAGTVTDPDGPLITSTWTVEPASGTTGTCAFADATALSTTVTCTDSGSYTLTLTVSDGADHEVTVTATLTINLRPGPLSLTTIVEPATGFVGGDAVVVTHTVRNGGVTRMDNVRFSTTLPPGLAPAIVNPANCASACDLGTLAPGQFVQIRFTFPVNAVVDLPVAATVTTTGPDTDTGDNTSSVRVVVRQPVLTIAPGIGPQGFVTQATGRDFPAGARIRLVWSVGISEVPGEVTVRPDGTFDARVLIFHKDTRGLRNLTAVPVSGPRFGVVSSNPFLVLSRSLKPLTFVIR